MAVHFNKTATWLTVIFTLLYITGCATLFSSTSQVVRFESNPSNVEVFLNGKSLGFTPLEVDIKKSTFDNFPLRFQKEGYKTVQQPLKKGLNNTALFNFTGMSSWATDAISGAMIQFTPDNYYIELTPQNASLEQQEQTNGRLFIVANQQSIKEEIAKGQGEHLNSIATHYGMTDKEEKAYYEALTTTAPSIVSIDQPLAFLNVVEPK